MKGRTIDIRPGETLTIRCSGRTQRGGDVEADKARLREKLEEALMALLHTDAEQPAWKEFIGKASTQEILPQMVGKYYEKLEADDVGDGTMDELIDGLPPTAFTEQAAIYLNDAAGELRSPPKFAVPAVESAENETDIAPNWKGGKRRHHRTSKRRNGSPAATRKAPQEGGKRKLGAFMKFANKMRPVVQTENPKLEFAAIGKELGRRWRALSAAEKASYK